jgi:ABC-type transport system involved in multi-copper enzyme maturation permease subunit
MDYAMVWRLVQKEWHFSRPMFIALVAAGVAMLVLSAIARTLDSSLASFVSSIMFFLVFNLMAWTPAATIGSERSEQTLAFLVSLPISIREYTAAKMVASLAIFSVGWLLLTGGAIGVNLLDEAMPNAYIPLTLVVLVQAFVLFCLFIAVTLVVESPGWTMVVGIVGNIVFWLSFGLIGVMPNMGVLGGPSAAWDSVSWLLYAQVAAIPVILGLTFLFQLRKTDFLR